MLLGLFERDADALLAALARARYLEASGQRAYLGLQQIYERFPEVPSLDAYEQLLDAEVEERIALGLQRMVLEQYVRKGLAAHDERVVRAEHQALVDWMGDAIPWRLARLMARLEPERSLRHDLDERIHDATHSITKARLDRLKAGPAARFELGQYDLPTDDLGFWAHVRRLAVADISKLAEWLLAETHDLYVDALRDQLVHAKLDDGDAWEVDIEWICRGEEYDRIFPQQQLVPTAIRLLWDLEIRLQDQTNVRLDLQELHHRVTESFCATIGVPDEVVATLSPRGGVADYTTLVRLLGEAESYAYADRTASVVYRRLGDRAVAEGYGLTLAGLLGRPDWLQLRLQADATRDAIRLQAFERLYRLRRAAFIHLWEVEARQHPEPEAIADEYAERFTDALYVRAFPERYLDCLDEPFAAAQHLRAALLGRQLGLFLEREIDDEWYRSVRAGRFLIDRWREGHRYTAEELVRFLGFEGLDPAPLLEELRAALVG